MRVEGEKPLGFFSSKGMNTLVAAVLLIAITLVIAVIVSTAISGLAKTGSAEVQTRAASFVNCSSSDIDVTQVYLDTGPMNVSRVAVRNNGQQRETIISAAMFNKTGFTAAPLTTFPVSLARGDVTNLLFNITGNVTCASFSQVVVTTECTFETFAQAPKNC
ncbi:MAG: hypothetical protein HYW26_00425 [Candidatus Aenigmarchaeota archaeon]|nr:hypothetical protein [Candidatus Aenigmarchaeota archaeon]